MIDAQIDNKKLLAAMKDLPIRIQKNIMVGATLAGANVVRDEARRRVRKKSKSLMKSIGTTRRRSKGRNEVIFGVSPRKGGKNASFYGRFIELGTSKMSAKPFLRPAAEVKVSETLVASKEYIAQRLPKEVAKARK